MTLIRFHGELNDLVPRPITHRAFGFRSAEHATLKHAIEAFGVPHTEVGRVLVGGVDGNGRVLLSRDRELLKHRKVAQGRYVRAQQTEAQLREVVRQFALWRQASPFSRCLACNAPLRAATREDLARRLPPDVAATHEAFTQCTGCGRVYWPGSHWRRLRAIVDAVMAEAPR